MRVIMVATARGGPGSLPGNSGHTPQVGQSGPSATIAEYAARKLRT
jgi:hypothetical protein